jgi:ribosome-associated translation inhibitor RaiA
MRNDLHLKDIHRTDGLENLINEKVQHLTEKLVQGDSDLHVDVRLAKDRQRTANRKPSYHCEVLVKSGMSYRMFKVIKHNESLFRAIAASFDSLKVMLGKTHDRLHHDRRRRADELRTMAKTDKALLEI